MKKRIERQELTTWDLLNRFLVDCTEDEARELMRIELAGRCRKAFLLRVHARFNKVRAARERRELQAKAS